MRKVTSPLDNLCGPGKSLRAEPPDKKEFEGLKRSGRKRLADAESVPAYIVFSDAVLARMAAQRPTDDAGLLAISGVGPAKLLRRWRASKTVPS